MSAPRGAEGAARKAPLGHRPLTKVLIANRGEIAVRIARSLREMGVTSVAVYSDADRGALHVRVADEAYYLGGSAVAESYLNQERVLAVAQSAGCDGLIPGYGFLSENAEFARKCAERGIRFVGPNPEAIEVMGNKPKARAHMQQAGVPVVPGGPARDVQQAIQTAQEVGYPVMLKAAAGGGGRGMRRVNSEKELPAAFEQAGREAGAAFGDGTIYIEKLVVDARHVEVQVLGDTHGNVVHLFDRDCSIQRRNQKVVEEAPSPFLSEPGRQRLCETALRGARSVSYDSAGTFEFLVDPEENFYFLEMNTRLQVEHPVTEMIVGCDLVREMVRIAGGEPLRFRQEGILRRGVALECRLYAEDPARGFLPSPGTIESLVAPEGPFVRHDSGVTAGDTLSFDYDPMVSKLCVWAADRQEAVERMRRALDDYRLGGLTSNLAFLRRVVRQPQFVAGDYNTGFIGKYQQELLGNEESAALAADPAAAAAVLVALLASHKARHAPAAPVEISEWALGSRRARLG